MCKTIGFADYSTIYKLGNKLIKYTKIWIMNLLPDWLHDSKLALVNISKTKSMLFESWLARTYICIQNQTN